MPPLRRATGTYFIDTATLIVFSSTWIPLDQPYEHLLVDELVRQERRFLKPLRSESKQGAAFQNAVLLDTGDTETPLDIVTPFMSDRDRSAKQHAVSQRAAGSGQLDMEHAVRAEAAAAA